MGISISTVDKFKESMGKAVIGEVLLGAFVEHNTPVDVKFAKRGDRKILVVTFEGANRLSAWKKFYPMFPDRYKNAGGDTLFIADSFCDVKKYSFSKRSVERDISLSGWYTLYQSVLEDILRKLSEPYEKLIFIGGSAGGFAALYFSHFFKDSICLVANPQTNINRHIKRISVVDTCLSEIHSHIAATKQLNVCDLYRKGFDNKVIYLTSMGSPADVFDHATPLLEAVRGHPYVGKRLLMKIHFWGVKGHSGSVLPDEVVVWLKMIMKTDTSDVSNILDAYHELMHRVLTADRIAGGR